MESVTPVSDKPEAVNKTPMDKKHSDTSRLTIFSVALFIILCLGVVIFLYYQNQQLKRMLINYQTTSPTPVATSTPIFLETAGPSASPNKTETTPTACTLEAKICPDGSSVGRSGPNCEFAPCPQ